MNFLIRADANKEIGSGHLMRCLALGQMLQDEGNNVYFATKTENNYLIERLKKEKFEIRNINSDCKLIDDAEYTAVIAKNISAVWVIIDGYGFNTEYQKVIKNKGFKLMCIDDISKFHFVSDIVLNQNLNAEYIFKYSCEPYTKLIMGASNVLLRREYRMLKDYNRDINIKCENLLVTFGGGDTEDYLLKILKSLNLINFIKFNVKILLGIDSEKCLKLIDLIKTSNHNIELLKIQDNIIPLIQWCDVAISASGSTVWELAILKTPVILMSISDNQVPVAEELVKKKSAIAIDKNSSINIYAETISELCINNQKRYLLSENISEIIDINSNNIMEYLC